MIELTAEMIIEIHDTTIRRYGGLPGILCLGTIDYLVARINDESYRRIDAPQRYLYLKLPNFRLS